VRVKTTADFHTRVLPATVRSWASASTIGHNHSVAGSPKSVFSFIANGLPLEGLVWNLQYAPEGFPEHFMTNGLAGVNRLWKR